MVRLEQKMDCLDTIEKKVKYNEQPILDGLEDKMKFYETDNLRQRKINDKF